MRQSAETAVDEVLDYAERWLHDGLAVVRPSFSVIQATVDMTNANQRLDALRKQGVHATATHLLVYAAALTALACSVRPPTHTLVVRNPQAKCALVMFAACAALLDPAEHDQDEDAGVH